MKFTNRLRWFLAFVGIGCNPVSVDIAMASSMGEWLLPVMALLLWVSVIALSQGDSSIAG